ncbi:cation diffusion facilitator family transporter [Gordonia sp. HY002]|uniref:cation diffusion facilitator family transporter n=1 Tax=Gordonia zhenghanii TaxID=2911516 RepID=UPI001EEF89B5|nr:cation diffusion facilitator family transporter [Gordonia zhenghanii]MCF8571091.1 cation diffusion facilitator family transporter [Gordonia zhenghanii]MCF8604020.1 cation diffusion facilitator family transporter [Gordonia zhenghanii]
MSSNHGHEGHSHGPSAADLASGATNRRLWPMTVSVVIIGGFFVVELVTGLLFGSLALVADAGHMLTDVVALTMGLSALLLARHGRVTDGRSFGWYRAEVFTAVVNAVLLIGVGVFVLVEAIRRIGTDPEVPGGPMIIVAALGLVANLVVMLLLRADAEGSIAIRGAYLEVLADAVGSVGVLVAGIVALTTGWGYADLIVAVLIAVWVVPRALKLARDALKILNQQAPSHIDLTDLRARLADVPGVDDVHDLHVWSVTTGMDVVTVHLTAFGDHTRVLADARAVLDAQGLEHATVQIESSGSKAACTGELTW